MFARTLIKDFDPKRLRNLLALFFLALTVPTAGLIWQAYSQLKWEAFYQYRTMAEELTRRIDGNLRSQIETTENRSFTDYAFLVVTGDPAANFLQRSPLSNYPVTQDLPGVIGYFQVGTNGEFSTPLLPSEENAAGKLGVGGDEYRERLALAQEIQQILADNRLVRSRNEMGLRGAFSDSPVASSDLDDMTFEEERLVGEVNSPASAQRQSAAQPEIALGSVVLQENSESAAANETPLDKDAADALSIVMTAAEPQIQKTDADESYSQQVFDQLNRRRDESEPISGFANTANFDDGNAEAIEVSQSINAAKIADLEYDARLQKKSEALDRKEAKEQIEAIGREIAPARAKRVEQSALPESIMANAPKDNVATANLVDVRISTFESEIDPYEFSLLDSGHFVLFRKVWRNGERYIQGLLISRQTFLQDIIESAFRSTALSNMSSLVVAYQDNVIDTFRGGTDRSYSGNGQSMEGALLYQGRLTTPLDRLELIFSINSLPPGPGATVLGWTTIVIAIVFLGGFLALYRIGLSQINLARQQQDFVSAISHELKTPLTSIRMYGEMLKEGWADEDKRQQYYGYIHDESERLTRLISNVLQLARITRNEPQFDMKATSVAALMSQIESKIATQVESANFELKFSQDAAIESAKIDVDEDCFTQIIINLVDNAIKFSKNAEYKCIEINSAAGRDGSVTFGVRDHGPGIPNDQMKKIFKLFYRSESELTRETVGTGIGLAIVHQLTTAMNGKVDVINREPGAEFKITFPGQ
jgi:signal transduction histidine kinase